MNDWKDWIGRTSRVTETLEPVVVNRMAATLDLEPNFVAGDTLPPAWHWLFFHEAIRASELGRDGHPALGVTMPPIPLERRMWAGGQLEFVTSLVVGAEATRTSRIVSITPKTGSTGTLYFVSIEHEITAAGVTALREQQTIVYRELVANSGAVSGPDAPTDGQYSETYHVNSTTLFRYSALTFNGHRIHYDTEYAREIEGYENLVIHGPLIATLLLQAAAQHGHEVAEFQYRAKSPLLLPDAFQLNGRIDGDAGVLWASTQGGRLAMEAQVKLRNND